MFNNDMTCPAQGFNTTEYPFPQTQEGTDFTTAVILAGTVVIAGAALCGAAHYQMNKIIKYVDENQYGPFYVGNKIKYLFTARKLTQLDPGHPSLLNPRIDQRTTILKDLIEKDRGQEIREYIKSSYPFRLRDDLFSFALDHNLDKHIRFLIESGIQPHPRFVEKFFELDESRQNQLIDKMIGPKVSPLRGQGIPERRRSRPIRKTLTEKQTTIFSNLLKLLTNDLIERNESSVWRIIDRLGAYQFSFDHSDWTAQLLFIENKDEAMRRIQFLQQNGLEINKDISDEVNDPETFPGPITLLDELQSCHQEATAEGSAFSLAAAQKMQALMDLLRRAGAKTWAELHPEATA